MYSTLHELQATTNAKAPWGLLPKKPKIVPTRIPIVYLVPNFHEPKAKN
jgi:hypothetical protein